MRRKSVQFLTAMMALAFMPLSLTGCQGYFVGPPQGSGGGAFGDTPILGATPFTFEPELETFAGFATDIWFFNPGLDTNDTISGNTPIGDGIDGLKNCGYEAFSTGDANPAAPEINFQFPITLSFISQWFLRDPDGSRKREIDVFGNQVYSNASLDISLVTGPVTPVIAGQTTTSILLNRALYPDGGTGFPLLTWTSPAANPIGAFPAPRQLYLNKQFNECSMITVLVQAGGTNPIASLGGAISDENNEYVETCGVPAPLNAQGAVVPVTNPTGIFMDIFAAQMIGAPVWQPNDYPPVTPPQRITDQYLEAALIEYSRHLAAVHANVVGQCVGLDIANDGTIMDSQMANFQNEYQYKFSQDDIADLATKIVGPTDPNDANKNVGLLPGKNR